jgi:3'(2'), 5'-bisphosphate nucleotidase
VSDSTDDPAELVHGICGIARTAGAAILRVYASDFAVEHKDDNSPLTEADLAAHRAIVDGLRLLTPNIPVLSEESAEQIPWNTRREWVRYWLVDPLDGTREFVKRNGEFTVNIALIEDHAPTMGVIYAPVLNEMYWAWRGGHACFDDAKEHRYARIHTRRRTDPVVIAGSRSHGDPRLNTALEKIGAHELRTLGSSLKFCQAARGNVDLYIRYGLTSEWDTAAGQCILEQAGGAVLTMDGRRLRYNTKESLLNPDFLACGDADVDWTGLLRE